MKSIVPFKGVFYNQAQVEQMKFVLFQSGDVLEFGDDQEISQYHFGHLLRGEGFEGQIYSQWCDDHTLIQDSKAAFYVHRRTFLDYEGVQQTQEGVFVAKGFTEDVLEKINFCSNFTSEESMRCADVIQETNCHISPVIALYDDSEHAIQSQFNQVKQSTPFFDVVLENGERHQLWRVTDVDSFKFVDRILQDKELFVVDGADQFKGAMQYQNQVLDRDGDLNDQAAYRHVLMYLVNGHEENVDELLANSERVAQLNIKVPQGLVLHSVGLSDLDGDIEDLTIVAA